VSRSPEEIRRDWLARLGRPAELDFPFFAVAEVYGRGPGVTIAAGELGTGSVAAGDALEAVGYSASPFPVRVARVDLPGAAGGVEVVASAAAGQVVGLTVEHPAGTEVVVGQCLAPPGRLAVASRVEADVWVVPAEDLPISPYDRRRLVEDVSAGRDFGLYVHTREVEARCETSWRPDFGGEASLAFELSQPVALYPGTRFALRYQGLTFGAGFAHE
jgi:translation elongation factor EF-Tu-like GTPase